MKASLVYEATMRSKNYMKFVIDLAEIYKTDPRKDHRIGEHECIYCFYTSRIGGHAITKSYCAICGVEMFSPSTCTDRLCISCANKHGLCKHCGGDIDMKIRRKTRIESEET